MTKDTEDKIELVAVLNAISEVAERIAAKSGNNSYKEVSRTAKRIASLEKEGFTEETILTILCSEGYINSEQLVYLLKMEN